MPSDAQVKRYKWTWSCGRYFVDQPNFDGGEMVLYAEHARIVAELTAQVERLSAPVTDEEIIEVCKNDWCTKKLSISGFSRLIAARLTPPQQEQEQK